MHYFQQITVDNDQNLKKLLTKEGEEADDLLKKALFKKHVEIINLELSYLCNRRCDYCPVKSSSRSQDQELMNVHVFRKIINELASIRYEHRISLNLYNEPLLDPNLSEKVAEIRSTLPWCSIAFNSNGDRLNRNVLESLASSGINYINVTLHPPGQKTQSSQTILFRIKKIMEKLGHDEGFQHLRQDFVQNNKSLAVRVLGVTVKVQWPNYHKEGTYRGGLIDLPSLQTHDRTAPCARPFREFTVYFDGMVVPCCEVFHDKAHADVVMGYVQQKTIFELYSSSAFSKFRRHVFTFGPKEGVCRKCSVVDHSSKEDDFGRRRLLESM